MSERRDTGSFRDPAGFVFWESGQLYRQVNSVYRAEYENLMGSGLYQALVDEGLLVQHGETHLAGLTGDAYKVIKPEAVPFVSYPYEWAFGQLEAAALATLRIERAALKHGMTLKDASAYNIQFIGCRPTLIDTLSFKFYTPGEPWVAYRQFCEHFLAPLALMSHRDVRLAMLLRTYLNGIPLDLAAKLLPWKTHLQSGLFMHLHLHAGRANQTADSSTAVTQGKMGKNGMLGLIDSLAATIRRLKPAQTSSRWADYYDEQPSYETLAPKDELVRTMLRRLEPSTVWDLGANTGRYTWLAADEGAQVVALDTDATCVQAMYEETVTRESGAIMPLVMDLANPSPALGSEGAERLSLFQRGPADALLALAIVHHLAIGNNLPLPNVARMFSEMSHSAIVEFVPPEDPMVRKMMLGRDPEGVHPYGREAFEGAFARYFTIVDSARVEPGCRRLYVLGGR